jgi:hypothetical protein
MKPAYFFLILFVGLLAARLCHVGILWAEEDLPLAAASQMQAGKTLYRDIWFDKPPLLPATYRLWRAQPGGPLRLAGAIYALLACILAYRFAGDLWGAGEARWAAALLAFYLTFDTPSAILPLAADLLMLAPHLAAVYLTWRGRPFWSGLAAGVAFAINSKGLFVLAACAMWSYRSLPALAAGFALPNLAIGLWLWSHQALEPYYEQVWKWGRVYAARTFVEHPIRNALTRTAGWVGFHAALVIAAFWFWRTGRDKNRWRWAGWLGLSLIAVAAGWRFFPRYFFQILPALVLLAARGICLMPRAARVVIVSVALLVPFVRFGPRYVSLARDLAAGRDTVWVDVAMDRDSRQVASLARSLKAAPPSDTLFVWGFRPELYVYTGLPAACRFLDSQPVTGVPADRHLVDSTPVASELAAANRRELIRSRPTLIMDGLGPYNPKLSIEAYPDLHDWLAAYTPVARTPTTIVYRLKSTASSPPESAAPDSPPFR